MWTFPGLLGLMAVMVKDVNVGKMGEVCGEERPGGGAGKENLDGRKMEAWWKVARRAQGENLSSQWGLSHVRGGIMEMVPGPPLGGSL